MALEVSCRRPVQIRAQSQAIKCGICGLQLVLEQVFDFPAVCVLPLIIRTYSCISRQRYIF